jgi:hypothetical protein
MQEYYGVALPKVMVMDTTRCPCHLGDIRKMTYGD